MSDVSEHDHPDDETFQNRWLELRRRIEGLRSILETQGSLVQKQRRGKPYWYLRYYTYEPPGRQQRSLYIGRDADAQRVQALLDGFRAPGEFLRETLLLADLAVLVARPLRRHARSA